MSPQAIKKLLETPFWLHSIEPMKVYVRQHDDTDGGTLGVVQVCFDTMGDAYLSIDGQTPWLRFRTYGGGGASLRTRTALMILAEAMRLDDADHPRRGHKV